MAYFVWDGSSSTDGTVAANWSGGSAPPNDGTAVLTFNNASDAGNSFDLNSINGYSIAGIQILSTFTKYLTNASTTSITLTGVEGGGPTNVAGIFAAIGGRMNINAALTFVFSNATLQSVDVTDIYYGVQFDSGQHSGSGDASIDSFFGMFFDQDSIDFTTFEFQISNKTLGLINGVYPNIKMNGTNTVLAPNNFNTIVITDEGVGNFSNFDRVKMADLTLTGTDDKLHPVIVSSNFRKNAIDYEKVFEITGAISIASDTFDWGYSTLEITPKDADVTIPTSSETSYGPATSYFNPRYHRLVINDNSYVCFMTRDSVLTCHDLDVRGKLYAKDTSQTDETTASEIHVSGSVSITGDWNFQQISDGIYRSFGTKQKVNVAHGGTGQRFFADNSVILGNGKAALSSLAMGSADEVLKVNSGGTALEFGAASGGGGLSDVVDDTTPQLGGDLDVNGNKITSASNADVTIEPDGTGDVNLFTDTVIVGDSGANFQMQHRTTTASILQFQSGGNTRLNSDGNIYLNTNQGGGSNTLIRLNGNTITSGTPGANVTMTTQGTGDLTLSTNSGTNSGTIKIADGVNGDITIIPNGTGGVGIGTSTVEYELDVDGTIRILPTISSNAGTAIRIGADGDSNDITLLRIDGGNPANQGESDDSQYGFSMKYIGSGTGVNNRYAMFMDNQGGTAIESMSILQDGKVGINRADPQALLHIKGSENSWDKHIRLEDHDTTSYAAIVYDDQGLKLRTFDASSSGSSQPADRFYFRNSNNDSTFFVDNDGDVEIPIGSLTIGNALPATAGGVIMDSNAVSGAGLANGAAATLFTVPTTRQAYDATIYFYDVTNGEYQVEKIIGHNTGSGVNYSTFGQVFSGSAAIGSLDAVNSSGTTLIQFTNNQGGSINYQAKISITHMEAS